MSSFHKPPGLFPLSQAPLRHLEIGLFLHICTDKVCAYQKLAYIFLGEGFEIVELRLDDVLTA